MMNTAKIIVLMSYVALASFSITVMTPTLPMLMSFYGIDLGMASWVVASCLAGYVVGQLIYAPLANRYGRIRALQYGLYVNIIGLIVITLSPLCLNYSLLLVGRVLCGIGLAFGMPFVLTFLKEGISVVQSKQLSSYIIIAFTLWIGVGIFVGAMIVQYLPWYAVIAILWLHGIFFLVATKCFPETLTKRHPIHPKAILSSLVRGFRRFQVVGFGVVLGATSFVSYGYATIAPVYSHDILLQSSGSYGKWNLLTMLGMFGGGLLSKWLLAHYQPSRVITINLTALVITVLVLILMDIAYPSVVMFYVLCTGLYLFAGAIWAPAYLGAMHGIENPADASGVLSFVNMCTSLVGVTILGGFFGNALMQYLTVLAIFIGLAYLVLFLLAMNRKTI